MRRTGVAISEGRRSDGHGSFLGSQSKVEIPEAQTMRDSVISAHNSLDSCCCVAGHVFFCSLVRESGEGGRKRGKEGGKERAGNRNGHRVAVFDFRGKRREL